MTRYFRSVVRFIYRVKHFVLLAVVIGTILFLSAYLGKNMFFSSHEESAEQQTVETVSSTTSSVKGIDSSATLDSEKPQDNTETEPDIEPEPYQPQQKESPMIPPVAVVPRPNPIEEVVVAVESVAAPVLDKVIVRCDKDDKADAEERYRKRLKKEEERHEDALRELYRTTEGLLESAAAVLFQREHDRHEGELAEIYQDYKERLYDAGCSR